MVMNLKRRLEHADDFNHNEYCATIAMLETEAADEGTAAPDFEKIRKEAENDIY
jgi:hypothetical protein